MKSITGQCPNCGADRNAHVIAEHEEVQEPTEEPLDPTFQGYAYRILKCAGCDTVYFQHESLQILGDSVNEGSGFADMKDDAAYLRAHDPGQILHEETSYWPALPSMRVSMRERPDWHKLSDNILISLLSSVYTALEHDLRVLAAIGMRVVFERASELVGVDPQKSFAKKLDELVYKGHIGAAQRESLEVLTDAGGAAAHRGWEPDSQQLEILASIMEHFVKSFVVKEEAGTLKQSIPPRYKQRTPDKRGLQSQLIKFPSPKPPKNP